MLEQEEEGEEWMRRLEAREGEGMGRRGEVEGEKEER